MRIHATVALILAPVALAGCAGGGAAPALRLTPETIDTILVSDSLYYVNGQLVARGENECDGGTCTTTLGGEEATTTAEEAWFLSVHAEAPAAGTVRRNGIGIGRIERDDIAVDDAPELTSSAVGYGAWARYVAFDATIQETETSIGRITAATASVGGIGNRSNPVGGSAEWSGAMVGLDYRDIAEQRFVQGDARVTADFADMDLDVALTGIAGLEFGDAYDDMTWEGLAMRDGAFETPTLSGRFFGPDHEEVGGVFDRDGILGAFGATRE